MAKRHESVRYDERMNVADLHHWRLAFNNTKSSTSTISDPLAAGDTPQEPLSLNLKSEPGESSFYDLKAFVAHSGEADSGHFITCRRVPDTPANVGNCR